MPRVSVILTTYNRPNRLKQAVDSVLNQTYQDFEILLMDDNSGNKEQIKLLKEYKKNPKINVFISDVKKEDRKEQVRYSVLINEAFKIATGEFIAYLCDDDRFELDRLQRFIDLFDAKQDIHFLAGDQYCMIEKDGIEQPMPEPIRKQTRVLTNPNCCVDHSSIMHRISVLKSVSEWKTDKLYWGHADGEFFEALGSAGFPMHPLSGHPTDTHVYHDWSWTKEGNHEKLGTDQEKI